MVYLYIYRYGPYKWAMTKTCKVCSATDESTEFYAGVSNRCKECHKEFVRKNRKEMADYYREYDAMRFQNDPRVRERHRRYQQTETGKASMLESRKKWVSKNPEKRAAHIILGNRIRSGEIVKPDKCEQCGCGGRLHGHHHDYSKPLEVEWLCQNCHVTRHK
jgi:hypothetical protein